MIVTEVRHNFFSFFLPHFPGAPRSERPLLPRRADALWEGPVQFGRNRESRSREAAGRRNWPEAVPKKMRGRKRPLTELSRNLRSRLGPNNLRTLLVKQVHQGIDACSAPAGDIAGEQSDGDQQECDDHEGGGIS